MNKLIEKREPSKTGIMKKDTIEAYYDPWGIKGGKQGCIRARVANNHGIHAAGVNIDDAIRDILLTLRSFGKSDKVEDYTVVK